jgi:hypothetical protein
MPSAVIKRSAAAVTAAASVHVESARTAVTLDPPMNAPESVASFMAISAAAAIGGVSDSIGPVKPKIIPSFTSAASAGAAIIVDANAVKSNFFISISLRDFRRQIKTHYLLSGNAFTSSGIAILKKQLFWIANCP